MPPSTNQYDLLCTPGKTLPLRCVKYLSNAGWHFVVNWNCLCSMVDTLTQCWIYANGVGEGALLGLAFWEIRHLSRRRLRLR